MSSHDQASSIGVSEVISYATVDALNGQTFGCSVPSFTKVLKDPDHQFPPE